MTQHVEAVAVTEMPSPDAATGGYAIDIGGTFAKIIYQKQVEKCGRFYMAFFLIKDIEAFMDFIKRHCSRPEVHSIRATGMGSHKFKNILESTLDIKVEFQMDEFQCNLTGLNYILSTLPPEKALYADGVDLPDPVLQFPYLLVTIGTGLSAVKIEKDGKKVFAFGTNRGGATFEGLGNLLIPGKTYDELMDLAEKGDRTAVSLTMADVADGPLGGLPVNAVTAYFGKAVCHTGKEAVAAYEPADLASGLLGMMAGDLVQLVFDYARRSGVARLYFCGNFVSRKVARDAIRRTMAIISRGTYVPYFPCHGGYIGAIGAYLIQSNGNKTEEKDDVFWSKK